MTFKSLSSKRALVSADESSDSGSTRADAVTSTGSVGKDDEAKTIPFLRRLVDMLGDHDNVISFYPGTRHDDGRPPTLGKIVVHDRLKVESMVLPRYFNHSSFASLRRQLNYFSFTRVGKGRQRGATYCNEGVVEMEDILRLKRRPTTSPATSAKRSRVVSCSEEPRDKKSTNSDDDEDDVCSTTMPAKKMRLVAPRPRRVSTPTIRADVPPVQHVMLDLTSTPTVPTKHPLFGDKGHVAADPQEDDILAGCNALLSFARGIHFVKSSS